MPFALLIPLIAQVGPSKALPQAPLEIHRRNDQQPAAAPPRTRMELCLEQTRTAPGEASAAADRWLGEAKGSARAEPEECKALALVALGRWSEARAGFIAARDDTPISEPAARSRRGALAGNVALAQGDNADALALLDWARADATRAADHALEGGIALDRARALVGLGRSDEASAALVEARALTPENALAWLLSATLSRRSGKLDEAQKQIEQAAVLAPRDPEVGLEAGVIAMLAGREDAARQSWNSVIAAAPGSDAARTAQGYLDQLGPPPQAEGR